MFGCKNWNMNQWDTIKSPEIVPLIYEQMIYKVRDFSGEIKVFFHERCWKYLLAICNKINFEVCFTPYTKNLFKMNPRLKCKT